MLKFFAQQSKGSLIVKPVSWDLCSVEQNLNKSL